MLQFGQSFIYQIFFQCGIIALDYKYTLRGEVEDDSELRKIVHKRSAERLLRLFEKNGGVYIKLGQYLASLVTILPKEYTETMKVLQDRAPWVSYEHVERIIYEEFGKPVEELCVSN